jgi:hypothetical protein
MRRILYFHLILSQNKASPSAQNLAALRAKRNIKTDYCHREILNRLAFVLHIVGPASFVK